MLRMLYEHNFLISLLLTIIIETITLFIIIKFFFKKEKITNFRVLFTGFLCSFATHPYVWFVFPFLVKVRLACVLIGEIFAILIESLIISVILKFRHKISILVSFICNLASFFLGLVFLRL